MIIVLLVFSGLPVKAQEMLEGRVVAIADGDTLTLLTTENTQVKIRLAQVDTPEKGQPYANRSRQVLGDLVFGKNIQVAVVDTDRYGRTVGRVSVGELDVASELVSSGAAWVYRRYATDDSLYSLEDNARKQGRGLWGLPESQQVPPWEWREARRRKADEQSIQPSNPTASCEAKKYCSQMSSCKEALFYLEQCKLTELDKDGDGRPCEWGVCQAQD